jgi:hypothetical protein
MTQPISQRGDPFRIPKNASASPLLERGGPRLEHSKTSGQRRAEAANRYTDTTRHRATGLKTQVRSPTICLSSLEEGFYVNRASLSSVRFDSEQSPLPSYIIKFWLLAHHIDRVGLIDWSFSGLRILILVLRNTISLSSLPLPTRTYIGASHIFMHSSCLRAFFFPLRLATRLVPSNRL